MTVVATIRVACNSCGAEFPIRQELLPTARCPICAYDRGELRPGACGSPGPSEDQTFDQEQR